MLRLMLILASLLSASVVLAEPATVFKSPTCGCCSKWVEHMAAHGYALEPKDMGSAELMKLKHGLGLKPEQASCHTAMIGGYLIEGHVPAREVQRLLAEKPDALGLAVPGMPIGSPGMESGDQKEAYDVLLIRKDGSTEVYARY